MLKNRMLSKDCSRCLPAKNVFSYELSHTKLQVGCHVPFTEAWFPSGHSTIKALLIECCRDGCPSGRFSHLYRGTLELCQSDHWVLGHLSDQGPSTPFAQFGWAASSKKSLVGSKLLPFKNDGGTVFLGTFNAADIFWYPSPDLCLDTIQSLSSRTVPLTSWFGFCSDMHCQPWDII